MNAYAEGRKVRAYEEMVGLAGRIDWSYTGLDEPVGERWNGTLLLNQLRQVDFSDQAEGYPGEAEWARWEAAFPAAVERGDE